MNQHCLDVMAVDCERGPGYAPLGWLAVVVVTEEWILRISMLDGWGKRLILLTG